MNIGKKLNCKFCGTTWNYTGTKTIYASCPNCMHKVRIGGGFDE